MNKYFKLFCIGIILSFVGFIILTIGNYIIFAIAASLPAITGTYSSSYSNTTSSMMRYLTTIIPLLGIVMLSIGIIIIMYSIFKFFVKNNNKLSNKNIEIKRSIWLKIIVYLRVLSGIIYLLNLNIFWTYFSFYIANRLWNKNQYWRNVMVYIGIPFYLILSFITLGKNTYSGTLMIIESIVFIILYIKSWNEFDYVDKNTSRWWWYNPFFALIIFFIILIFIFGDFNSQFISGVIDSIGK